MFAKKISATAKKLQKQTFRFLYKQRKGTLLAEAAIAVLIFGLFATAAYLTLLTGQESSRTGSARVRGVIYTEQALEVGKAIRDQGFDNLVVGTHGYTIDEDTDAWVLSGAVTSRYNFETYLTISDLSSTKKQLIARSDWGDGYYRPGTAFLSTVLTNWREKNGIGDWSNATVTGSWLSIPQVDFNDMFFYKDYLYISSDVGSFGDGLYILDLSDPTNPTRVSDAFTLPDSTDSIVAYKDVLYIATQASPDILAYDISDPTALNGSTVAIASDTLPGGPARARSFAFSEDRLYVGATGHPGQDEFFIYDITTGSTLTLLDSYNVSGNPDVNDIFIEDDFAYLATSGSNELIVLDVSDSSDIGIYTSVSMGNTPANGVRVSGTGFIVGMDNSAFFEYAMRTGTAAGLPGNDPSDLFSVEIGGSVNDVDMDPLGCYSFLATDNSTKELTVRSANDTALAEIGSADIEDTGPGRGIHYDFFNDRVYVATESGVYIYVPDSGPTCL